MLLGLIGLGRLSLRLSSFLDRLGLIRRRGLPGLGSRLALTDLRLIRLSLDRLSFLSLACLNVRLGHLRILRRSTVPLVLIRLGRLSLRLSSFLDRLGLVRRRGLFGLGGGLGSALSSLPCLDFLSLGRLNV